MLWMKLDMDLDKPLVLTRDNYHTVKMLGVLTDVVLQNSSANDAESEFQTVQSQQDHLAWLTKFTCASGVELQVVDGWLIVSHII
jgi:hypothetical protein